MPDFNNIFKELKKRKVFRSIGIYAAFAFISIQVCSIVFPALHLPDWTTTFVVVLAIMGFPATLILSWIYDVTSEGIEKTDKNLSSGSTNYSTTVLILVIVLGLLFYFQDKFFKPKANPKSIAVMPFDNFSPKSEDEYLSAGFTEVIIANLAKVQDLMVISRTSVMRYQESDKSLKEIAEELNVANILEGSIQRNGNKIRVVGQLIEAKTDKHLWAETYDEYFDDIFSIQTNIAKEIASALQSKITESEKSDIEDKLTENIDAYQYYLKGIEMQKEVDYWNENKYRIMIEMFTQAFNLDPEFSEAYARASIIYSETVHFGVWRNEETIKKALTLAEKAISLKSTSALAHVSRGYYYYACLRNYNKALDDYNYALKREPGNAGYNGMIAWVYRRMGEYDKAIQFLEKALQLDPNTYLNQYTLMETYELNRSYRKLEIRKLIKAYIIDQPGNQEAYIFKANHTFHIDGHTKNARKILEDARKINSNFNFDFDYYIYDIYDLIGHNYDHALENIITLEDKLNSDSLWFMHKLIYPKYFFQAEVYYLQDDLVEVGLYAKKSLQIMENVADQYKFEDPRYHSALSNIYIFLNDEVNALDNAKLSVSIYPPSKDHLGAQIFQYRLAIAYAAFGYEREALAILEELIRGPSFFNWRHIKYNRYFNKLLGDNKELNKLIKEDETRYRNQVNY